ncbi:MAG TPA: hypothetical protein VLG12_02890 [Candidatus Saccharimonadales bacterium]|nr:hypothetical protein [Candidatus Saccharimonadales bacterium]
MNFKRIIVVALTGIIVLIGLVIIAYISTPKSMPQNQHVLTPTPIQNATNNTGTNRTPLLPSTKTNTESTFEKRIDQRPVLSASDTIAKQTAIVSIKQNPDAIYETNEYKIMYIESYDMFQVEISTTNVKQAEDDVLAWFTTKGISKDAVCKIPVEFYLSFSLKQQLNQGVPPLFYGC